MNCLVFYRKVGEYDCKTKLFTRFFRFRPKHLLFYLKHIFPIHNNPYVIMIVNNEL